MNSTFRKFAERVEPDPSGCWLWTATIQEKGYGIFYVSKEDPRRKAHRFSYEHYYEPIPEGLTLDHLCRVRHCVFPGHLEPVTPKENILRGEGVGVVNSRKKACPYGHPLDGKYSGRRYCKTCDRTRARAAYWANKDGEDELDV